MVLGLLAVSMSSMYADDGFYVRAMSWSNDGTADVSADDQFKDTIGFPTRPVAMPRSSQKRKLDEARNDQLACVEKQPQKKRGKLSTYLYPNKTPKN